MSEERCFRIIVEGDYACFTRPEHKADRVSYRIPPPGALEGMLRSVYWKPAIGMVIDKIVVFRPIRFENIMRAEVSRKIDLYKLEYQRQCGNLDPCIYAEEARVLRNSAVLRQVRYGVEFHLELTGLRSERDLSEGVNLQRKHEAEMERRLRKGQFFRPPCLGSSEFLVRRMEMVQEFDLSEVAAENRGVMDLGWMEYRVNFLDRGHPKNEDWEARRFGERAETEFYHPVMRDGVVDVQQYRKGVTGC